MSGAKFRYMLGRPGHGAGSAPVVDVAPLLVGTTAVDQILTVSNGLWLNGPTSFQYRYEVSADGSTGWAVVGGHASNSLFLAEAFEGKYLRAAVRGVNSVGQSEWAYTAVRGPVAAEPIVNSTWPGPDWDGGPKSGWLNAGKSVPVPTTLNLVTPGVSCRLSIPAWQRYGQDLTPVILADAPGGVAFIEVDYENRVSTLANTDWFQRPQRSGGMKWEYGYPLKLDHAAAVAMLSAPQAYGEAWMFVTVHANNPAIPPTTFGIGVNNTTDTLTGMVFYPCQGPEVDHYVNVARTPGFVHPVHGPAEVWGADALRDGYVKVSENRGQCWGLRIIEQLPTGSGGKMEGWRLGAVPKINEYLFCKWWNPLCVADDVVAIMGDDSLIYTQIRVDMLKFEGSPVAGKNLKFDWARIAYQMQNSLYLMGRSGIWFDGVEGYYGTPLVVDGVNPFNPTGPVGSGSGQACLYGGRQCGNYIGSTQLNPMETTYMCWVDCHFHDMAAFGIAYGKVINNVLLDGVSGSGLENCVGAAINVELRNIGGVSTGFRTHRSALKILKGTSTAAFRWIEKTSINSAGSMPGSVTLNTGTGYEPQVGSRDYKGVTMTTDGTMQGQGVSGGFGAKADFTVTNGQIVASSIKFVPPTADAGVKYRIGEKLRPAMMPTSGSPKGSFFYVDGAGVSRSGYGTSTPDQFEFTSAGNLNLYEWPTNDPVAAKAAGPVKAMLLQERAFSIKELAEEINHPTRGWGPEYLAECDPAWSDVSRYDSTMLSRPGLEQAAAIPMTAFASEITFSGIMDIHSDNYVHTQSAFNYLLWFAVFDDFEKTAWLSSGRSGRRNGGSIRWLVSRARDAGSPQGGYFQCWDISTNLSNITSFAPNGTGATTFFGTGYQGYAGRSVYNRWLTDDMFWSIARDADTSFTNSVFRVANTARLTALVGESHGQNKGLAGAFAANDLYEDPNHADARVGMRPKLNGPAKLADNTYAGALLPTELVIDEDRPWNMAA